MLVVRREGGRVMCICFGCFGDDAWGWGWRGGVNNSGPCFFDGFCGGLGDLGSGVVDTSRVRTGSFWNWWWALSGDDEDCGILDRDIEGDRERAGVVVWGGCSIWDCWVGFVGVNVGHTCVFDLGDLLVGLFMADNLKTQGVVVTEAGGDRQKWQC